MIGIEKKGLALTQVANVISARAIKSARARRSVRAISAAAARVPGGVQTGDFVIELMTKKNIM